MGKGLDGVICLKSEYNNKYLRYRNESVQTHGLLQFSAEKPIDPLAHFKVDKAWCSPSLIHLKSRYSNKYLVRWSPNHYWITASADERNENQREWSCTLFKPIIIEDNGDTKKARLMHVQLGHYACLWRIGAPFDSCLFAGSKDTDRNSCDIVTVLDWSSLLKLPKHVAFKGENGKYIGAFLYNGRPCLQFSFDHPNDPKVAHEVFGTRDSTLYIKSKYYGKFWRLDDKDDLIVADVTDPGDINNKAIAMFRPNVIDINVIALLNMSKTWYCKRFTDGLLSAATESVDRFATLEVKDLGNMSKTDYCKRLTQNPDQPLPPMQTNVTGSSYIGSLHDIDLYNDDQYRYHHTTTAVSPDTKLITGVKQKILIYNWGRYYNSGGNVNGSGIQKNGDVNANFVNYK